MSARTAGRRTPLAHRPRRAAVAPLPGRALGQCFDVEVTPDLAGWSIGIPELDGRTHARRRSAVASAARSYIAARTGIPLGYIVVLVRD